MSQTRLRNTQVIPPREILSGDRAYYVSTTGSDANNGLTVGTAFASIQKAIDTSANTLDSQDYNISINLSSGSYIENVIGKNLTGTGTITIQGTSGCATDVYLNSFTKNNAGSRYSITNLTFAKTIGGTTSAVSSNYNAYISLGNVAFLSGYTYHIYNTYQGITVFSDTYYIKGGCNYHMVAVYGSFILCDFKSVYISGSPALGYYAYSDWNSILRLTSNTYVGTATGTKYYVGGNSIIVATSGSAYLPGNIAGSVAYQGQYIY